MSTLRAVRPDGFYWVKYCGTWTIAYHENGCWVGLLSGYFDMPDKDSHFDEIGERIVRRAGPECPRCGVVVLSVTDAHECEMEASGE